MKRPWVIRMSQPGWAPTFISWHASQAAALRALREVRKAKQPGTVLEVLNMDEPVTEAPRDVALDLLAALKDLMEAWTGGRQPPRRAWEKARAAIAKAEATRKG